MPVDVYGLTLTATDESAEHYRAGQDQLRHLRPGARQAFERAWRTDSSCALAAAAIALDSWASGRDDASAWAATADEAAHGLTEREASHVYAVLETVGGRSTALLRHLREFPGDCVALHQAVGSVGTPGPATWPQHTWRVAEGAGRAYPDDDWWFPGLLAYVRHEQGLQTEAAELAARSLAANPDAGQAAHASAHVSYALGDHAAGASRLDSWLADDRPVSTRAHFAWHAGLHELALGRFDALRKRFDRELAPGRVDPARLVIDSCSLLWRWQLDPDATDLPGLVVLREAVDTDQLCRADDPFAGMHAAVAAAALRLPDTLTRLASAADAHGDPDMPGLVAPLARGLRALLTGDVSTALDLLAGVQESSIRFGGSAAQRSIIEASWAAALLAADRPDAAGRSMDAVVDGWALPTT